MNWQAVKGNGFGGTKKGAVATNDYRPTCEVQVAMKDS
jgi:hypothetical protein